MTTERRGSGDEGAAEDLLPLADRDIYPDFDLLKLAVALSAIGTATASDRSLRVEEARRIAGENPIGQRMVDRKVAGLKTSTR